MAVELVTAKTEVGAVLDVVASLSLSKVVIKILFSDHGTGGGEMIAHAFHCAC